MQTPSFEANLQSISFMATYGTSPMNAAAATNIRRKKNIGTQKRDALEKEVSTLQTMLQQEVTMHEILERIHNNKGNGADISIPNFLPPKVKELLTELAMVEGEIARLESQISELQLGLKNEKETTINNKDQIKKPKHVTWHPATPMHHLQSDRLSNSSITSTPMHHFMNRSGDIFQEKSSFDQTKALHYISKAIKGDLYSSNDFTMANDNKMGASRDYLKELNVIQEESKFQGRIPRKSGLFKSPSPYRDFRDPRYSTPRPTRERNAEVVPTEILPKALSNSILSEETTQQWQPNKLSENIMKCLNFIYVRLLRTSRAMELEKSGPVSRSLHSSLISRSFRSENSINPKSSLILQRESRQQDPYGIFDVEESIPRDIGPYKNLVIFASSSMDTKCISSSIPLLKKLRVLMNNLQTVDLKLLTYQQKLAFWINMYNACIMHGFLLFGVPSSSEKLLSLMNKATLNIGGNTINAQAIEHYILRKPGSSSKLIQKNDRQDDKEAIVRNLYGLESTDPNVTFALSCGTRSSPAVRIYTADGVTTELEKSKLEYLQASVVVTSTKKIAFPDLLLRNVLDFAMDEDTLVEWVCHQLPTSGSLRKSIVDCFRGHNSGKIPTVAVDKIPYDYEFQYLLAM